jgi:hypothetical protein
MTGRDWDKELAKIDRQLAALPDDALARPPASPAAGGPAASAPAAARSAVGRSAAAGGGRAKAWAWTKVLLAVAAATGLWLSPFPARCGAPLLGLVAAAAAAALLGVWSAVGTWRHRLAPGHLLSLLATAAALVLGAREVLPRVGYARPTFDRPASWRCLVDAPSSPAPSPGPGLPTGRPSATLPSR